MKTVKHILSYACNKKCSYCINELSRHTEKQNKNHWDVAAAYSRLRDAGFNHLIITGGEPAVNSAFQDLLYIARAKFNLVTVMSAHKSVLSDVDVQVCCDDVVFSFHKEYIPDVLPKVKIKMPVYASMIYETWEHLTRDVSGFNLIKTLRDDCGFAGLTVRQMYPDGAKIPNESILHATGLFESFSIRVDGQSNCIKPAPVLLPDLTLMSQDNFVNFLYEKNKSLDIVSNLL